MPGGSEKLKPTKWRIKMDFNLGTFEMEEKTCTLMLTRKAGFQKNKSRNSRGYAAEILTALGMDLNTAATKDTRAVISRR